MGEGNSFSLFTSRGGVPGLNSRGGGFPVSGTGVIPSLRSGGGPSLRSGGVPSLNSGGVLVSGPGGVPLVKGKIFDTRLHDTCSEWEKKFLLRDPPPLKGKFFDTRFGLIHVQNGKKNFC